ncbi:hypothetical protein TNCV_223941 [Trichonephila clavipes]|nr:hypothetical protein TNCV_223941 [Trichonephila clavipes]
MHLQTSVPFPGFEPRPYGTAVSVIHHCPGWAALLSSSSVRSRIIVCKNKLFSRSLTWDSSLYPCTVTELSSQKCVAAVYHNASPNKSSTPTQSIGFLYVRMMVANPRLAPNENSTRITIGTEPELMNGPWGCGSPMVRVSDHGRHGVSSNPVPLKTLRVGE